MDLDKELIEAVKTRPVLYNINDPMYKDIEFKQKIWWEIGQKILEAKDESTAVSALKVRWKSLRDAYVKERKNDLALTYGMKAKPKKPWRLKAQMEFLAPFIHLRKDISTTTETKTVLLTKTTEVKNRAKTLNIKTFETVGENSSHFDLNLFNQRIPKSNVQRFIEIDSFFRDIANAVKCLNRNSQLSLEKEITNLVMNYKLKELEDEKREQSE